MMKFSDYSNSEKEKRDKNQKSGQENNLPPQAKMLLKAFVKDYEGKSEDELIQLIVETAKKNKLEGKLTDSDIDNFYNMLAPLVDANMKKTLDSVVKTIKKC